MDKKTTMLMILDGFGINEKKKEMQLNLLIFLILKES